jgi:hypothetical protein
MAIVVVAHWMPKRNSTSLGRQISVAKQFLDIARAKNGYIC